MKIKKTLQIHVSIFMSPYYFFMETHAYTSTYSRCVVFQVLTFFLYMQVCFLFFFVVVFFGFGHLIDPD